MVGVGEALTLTLTLTLTLLTLTLTLPLPGGRRRGRRGRAGEHRRCGGSGRAAAACVGHHRVDGARTRRSTQGQAAARTYLAA